MQQRKDKLVNNCYYHIYSRSIAKFVIFNNDEDYFRFQQIMNLYLFTDLNHKYSRFSNLDITLQNQIINQLKNKNNVLVEIVAFCLMPTHVHLILKQITNNGISKYLAKVFNSYSRYFNIKHKRNGPLWAGRFKSVLISDDEQLLHLTRYIHLNPTSEELVKRPQDWQFSSYHQYINSNTKENKTEAFNNLFNISSKQYKEFVMDRKSYQQKISKIKSLMIDNYTG